MIIKKNFDLRIVFFNIWKETALGLGAGLLAWALYRWEIATIALPFSIAAIMGSGLAIFIAFRNQSAYGRWWEARTLWGGIVNNSRIFARQVIANTDDAFTAGKVSAEQAAAYKREMVYRQIAFAHALRLHLRRQDQWQELAHLLSPEAYRQLLKAHNKPNVLLQHQGMRIKEGMRQELLGAFDNISMEPNLAALNVGQGACERIKNTPLPRNYHYFTRLFLYAFLCLLPFCLTGDFFRMNMGPGLIPVSWLVGFVFSVMNRVGEINEDPFENNFMDVPMTALCNTIERDLKEQLGEQELPERILPQDGYLY